MALLRKVLRRLRQSPLEFFIPTQSRAAAAPPAPAPPPALLT
jgi:hypothetical protein